MDLEPSSLIKSGNVIQKPKREFPEENMMSFQVVIFICRVSNMLQEIFQGIYAAEFMNL